MCGRALKRPPKKRNLFLFTGFCVFLQKPPQKVLLLFLKHDIIYLLRKSREDTYTILLYTTFLKKAREVGKKVRNFSYFSPHFYLFFVKNGLSPLSLRKGARETRQKEGIEKHIQGSFYGFLHFLERGGRRVYRHRQ